MGELAEPEEAFDVDRLVAGDARTAHAFEARFARLLRIKARMRDGRASAAAVDDIIRETLARVLEALRQGRVKDVRRIGAFVSRTADFVMGEAQRQRTRVRPAAADHERGTRDDPDERVALHERAQLAEELMASLPLRDRDILRSIFADRVDKDTVCVRYQVDRNHLRLLVARAKDRLRALVARQHDGKLAREQG